MRHSFVRQQNRTGPGAFELDGGPIESVSPNARFLRRPGDAAGGTEIRGLNGRNRPATTSLRFESAAGRKMERVITKPDPDSADVDLSQREHLSPSEWENQLLYGQHLIDRSLIRTAWRVKSQYFARYPD